MPAEAKKRKPQDLFGIGAFHRQTQLKKGMSTRFTSFVLKVVASRSQVFEPGVLADER